MGEKLNKQEFITMNKLCDEFFTKEIMDEFGVGENHDKLLACPRQNGVVFEGNEITRNKEEFNQKFISFLKIKGYGPKNISNEGLISEEIKRGWLMYSNDHGEDIWVNLHGGYGNNGAWLDFMITNTPEMIINPNEMTNECFLESLLNQDGVDTTFTATR